jgi:DNA-binding SARP family transcriptional activator
VEFGVLGPLAVWSRAGERLALGTPKARALLAVLLCRAGRPVTDDALAEAVWNGEPPKNAAKNIQLYVHQLRRRFDDPGRIVRQGAGYLLKVEPNELDAARFEELAAEGRAAAATGELERAGGLLHEALALWRGDAYGDIVNVPVVAVEADRVTERRLSVLEKRIDVDMRLGRHAELIGELTALATEHPLRERFWAQLMLALYRCERRADALAAYTRAREILVEETGLDPGRELRHLHQAILGHASSLDLPAVHADARREEPGRLLVPRMLPRTVGDFTGQEAELTGIEGVFAQDREPREPAVVVAVSGRGGIGKTTLAVHAAHRLRHSYPDGQLFAVLAGARPVPVDPHEVLGRFLRAFGVPDAAVPESEDERAAMYRSMLADRRMLLVLDDAKDERQIERLLPGSGTCGVIVTSRARLGGLAGAHRVDLGELSDADGEALLGKIVGDRQAAADPAEVKELLGLCAGLPLALRIAGSLLATRPYWRMTDLIARLADARHRLDGLRHRDLEVRASFALSYQGLGSDARRLFRLLGLLETPDFPVWTAAAMLDVSPQVAQDLLDELVDVRLVDVTTTGEPQARYRFHDLIRVFARERAETEESTEARREALTRAFAALLALAEIVLRADEGGSYTILRGDAPRWRPDLVAETLPEASPLAWLRPERLSLLAAVRQTAELGLDELCCELALGGFHVYLAMCCYDDWAETHQRALAVTKAAGNRGGQARLLSSLSALHYARRRFDIAEEYSTRALRLFEEIGDWYGLARALRQSAQLLAAAGRLDDAIACGRKGHRLLDDIGDAVTAADCLSQVGRAHLEAGDAMMAVDVLTKVVAKGKELGCRFLVMHNSYWLGRAYMVLGRYADAEQAFTTLSDLSVASEDRIGQIYAAHAWGSLYLASGRHAEARQRLSAGLAAAREANDRLMQARILIDLAELALGDADHDTAAGFTETAVELARSINSPLLHARALDRLGRVRTAAGDQAAARDARRQGHEVLTRIGVGEAADFGGGGTYSASPS